VPPDMAGLLTSYELDCGKVEGEGLVGVGLGVRHLVLETSSDCMRSASVEIGRVQVLGRIAVQDLRWLSVGASSRAEKSWEAAALWQPEKGPALCPGLIPMRPPSLRPFEATAIGK
jgi:hypothetical protein